MVFNLENNSIKFQEVLIHFEKQFPLQTLDINEFERRVKKLVYTDEHIYVWQIVECFKTCKGFEDIENSTSLSLSLMISLRESILTRNLEVQTVFRILLI